MLSLWAYYKLAPVKAFRCHFHLLFVWEFLFCEVPYTGQLLYLLFGPTLFFWNGINKRLKAMWLQIFGMRITISSLSCFKILYNLVEAETKKLFTFISWLIFLCMGILLVLSWKEYGCINWAFSQAHILHIIYIILFFLYSQWLINH